MVEVVGSMGGSIAMECDLMTGIVEPQPPNAPIPLMPQKRVMNGVPMIGPPAGHDRATCRTDNSH